MIADNLFWAIKFNQLSASPEYDEGETNISTSDVNIVSFDLERHQYEFRVRRAVRELAAWEITEFSNTRHAGSIIGLEKGATTRDAGEATKKWDLEEGREEEMEKRMCSIAKSWCYSGQTDAKPRTHAARWTKPITNDNGQRTAIITSARHVVNMPWGIGSVEKGLCQP